MISSVCTSALTQVNTHNTIADCIRAKQHEKCMTPLRHFIKPFLTYRKQLSLSMLLNLLLALSSVALLCLSGWFISAAAFAGLLATTASAFNYFIPAAVIRLLAFIRILSRYQDRVTSHDVTFKILATLRVWFYEKLIPLSPGNLLLHRSGDLLNQFVNDINTLDHLYLNVVSPSITTALLTLLATLFISYFSFTLAIIFLLMLCITNVIIPYLFSNRTRSIGAEMQTAMTTLRIHAVDMLHTFSDIVLFHTAEKRKAFLTNDTEKLLAAQEKLSSIKAILQAMIQFGSGLTVWLVLFFGIPLVRNNIMSGAELAMMMLLTIGVFEHAAILSLASLLLGKTEQAASRIQHTVSEKPCVTFPIETMRTHNHSYDITLSNVSFTYPNRDIPAIRNMDLCIHEGKHIGITGDSGAGKSTLLHLLCRIWDPQSGEIKIGNVPLTQFSEIQLRRMISVVTQHVHIFNASIRDNLTMMDKKISDNAIFSALEKVNLSAMVSALPNQLDTEMGEFGKNFSGGQIRRIALVRALLRNTPILLLDEPSTGLEADLLNIIWDKCSMDFKNKTVIVATHDQNLLSKMDYVVSVAK